MFSDTRDSADDCRNKGNGRNANPSSGSQVIEADRPAKRLRKKRKLPLDSEDEENADEDEVNESACVFFRELRSREHSVSHISLCDANRAEVGGFVPMRWVWV